MHLAESKSVLGIKISENLLLVVSVLYTFSSDQIYAKLYDKVKKEFPWCNFVLENGQEQQITGIIGMQPTQEDIPPKHELRPFFSFMVDDMIFFNQVDILMCLTSLELAASSYALHLKLSPNICFSHTSNKLITLPKFEPTEFSASLTTNPSPTELDLEVSSQFSSDTQSVEEKLRLNMLKFRRSETELDWNYPFDFCGSIYRL